MNLMWSTLLFNVLAVCLLLSGCASKKKKIGNVVQQKPLVMPDEPDPKENTTKMQISYGNKSAKVNLLIDVNAQDINLKMSGHPKRMSKFPWLDAPNNQSPSADSTNTGPQSRPQPSKEQAKAEDPWGDVMDIPRKNDLSKKELEQVLTEIRKAQEFFYKKQYQESLEMTKQSLEKQQTAEGYALMGSILYMMGDKSGAKQSWKQSLRLNPDMPAVTQMLEKLK